MLPRLNQPYQNTTQPKTNPYKTYSTKPRYVASKWQLDKHFEECCMQYLEKQTNIFKDLEVFDIVKDKERQLQGIDIIGRVHGQVRNIDVKSIASMLPTFCFEISGNVHSGQIGWLLNENVKTDYYLLTYHEIEGAKNDYRRGKEELVAGAKVEYTLALLISKKKIVDLIKTHLHSDNLYQVIEQIRNNANNYQNRKTTVRFKVSNNNVYFGEHIKGCLVYPTLSPYLHEQPINVVINRTLLEEAAEKIWEIY